MPDNDATTYGENDFLHAQPLKEHLQDKDNSTWETYWLVLPSHGIETANAVRFPSVPSLIRFQSGINSWNE